MKSAWWDESRRLRKGGWKLGRILHLVFGIVKERIGEIGTRHGQPSFSGGSGVAEWLLMWLVYPHERHLLPQLTFRRRP